MNKYFYVLMAKGYIDKNYLPKSYRNKSEKIKKEKTKIKRWNVPHYSDVKYVVAKDEDVARAMIREKLKSKWTGFRLIRNQD